VFKGVGDLLDYSLKIDFVFKVYFLLLLIIIIFNSYTTMPLSREKRTSLFRQRVEEEWIEYYYIKIDLLTILYLLDITPKI